MDTRAFTFIHRDLPKHKQKTFDAMSSASANCNRLSTLTPKLLIKVIAEVPLKSFLAIKHTKIKRLEDEFQDIFNWKVTHAKYLIRHKTTLFSLLGDLKPDEKSHIGFARSGPQYLHFLESNMVPHSGKDVVVEGSVRGERTEVGVHVRHFWSTLESYNIVPIEMRILDPVGMEILVLGFPRGIVWYYGVEGLNKKM